MEVFKPFFKAGDFVRCSYDRFPFLYDWYEEELAAEHLIYYGVVVYADGTHHEYLDEFIYEVLCLDGEKRYFMESELMKM